MVEVTQAERDAAFAVLVHTDDNNGYGREYIRDGLYDGNMVVQAFAAIHQAGLIEGRRQMREEAAKLADGYCTARTDDVARGIRAIPIGDE